jgi:hypothetical protein
MEKIEQLQQAANERKREVRAGEQAYVQEKRVLDAQDQKLSGELAS